MIKIILYMSRILVLFWWKYRYFWDTHSPMTLNSGHIYQLHLIIQNSTKYSHPSFQLHLRYMFKINSTCQHLLFDHLAHTLLHIECTVPIRTSNVYEHSSYNIYIQLSICYQRHFSVNRSYSSSY